jgi:hypothetical protein
MTEPGPSQLGREALASLQRGRNVVHSPSVVHIRTAAFDFAAAFLQALFDLSPASSAATAGIHEEVDVRCTAKVR